MLSCASSSAAAVVVAVVVVMAAHSHSRTHTHTLILGSNRGARNGWLGRCAMPCICRPGAVEISRVLTHREKEREKKREREPIEREEGGGRRGGNCARCTINFSIRVDLWCLFLLVTVVVCAACKTNYGYRDMLAGGDVGAGEAATALLTESLNLIEIFEINFQGRYQCQGADTYAVTQHVHPSHAHAH